MEQKEGLSAEINLPDYIIILLNRKRFIATITIEAAVIIAIYKAETKILLSIRKGRQ